MQARYKRYRAGAHSGPTRGLNREWLPIPILGTIIPKMGTIEKSGLAGALFTKTQRRVLGLLFGNPDRSYYSNEIVRFAGAGIGAVQRELERLAVAHLVTVTKLGNQKHYQANRKAPIFEELRGIALKTFGVADYLREALAPLAKRISAAFIFGSIAKRTDTASSDIDVMIVSDDLSFPDVIDALTEAEGAVGRSINPSVYGRDEWRRKLKDKTGFLQRVMKQPRIYLIGSDDDLPETRKPGKDR
jgi:predicted nucleotidyltransferase